MNKFTLCWKTKNKFTSILHQYNKTKLFEFSICRAVKQKLKLVAH